MELLVWNGRCVDNPSRCPRLTNFLFPYPHNERHWKFTRRRGGWPSSTSSSHVEEGSSDEEKRHHPRQPAFASSFSTRQGHHSGSCSAGGSSEHRHERRGEAMDEWEGHACTKRRKLFRPAKTFAGRRVSVSRSPPPPSAHVTFRAFLSFSTRR